MYKTFFSFSISHCMVSALIDCLTREYSLNPHLHRWNRKEIPHRLSLQTCSLSTTSACIPAMIDGTNSRVESRYICRYRKQ